MGDEDEEVEGYPIPAANISDVDLSKIAKTHPEEAREIARLGERLNEDDQTDEEFRRLCQLLYDVGETRQAEYLLRRNLDEEDESYSLYIRLFVTKKQDEFRSSIKAFKRQFGVELEFRKKRYFLDETYHSKARPDYHGQFDLLSEACEVRFDYSQEDFIAADVWNLPADADQVVGYLDSDRNLVLHFLNGVWEMSDATDI